MTKKTPRQMPRDLSYETHLGPKTKTDSRADFISLGRKSSQFLPDLPIFPISRWFLDTDLPDDSLAPMICFLPDDILPTIPR